MQMIHQKKNPISRIAMMIKAIPFVSSVIETRRKFVFRLALSLYRKEKFLCAAAYKQAGLFVVTLVSFGVSLYSNMQEVSPIIWYGKVVIPLIGVCYPVMYAYFGSLELSRRKKTLPDEARIKCRKKIALLSEATKALILIAAAARQVSF